MDDVLVLVQPQLVQNDIGDFVPAGPPLTQQIFGSISSVNRAEWYSAARKAESLSWSLPPRSSITAVSRRRSTTGRDIAFTAPISARVR